MPDRHPVFARNRMHDAARAHVDDREDVVHVDLATRDAGSLRAIEQPSEHCPNAPHQGRELWTGDLVLQRMQCHPIDLLAEDVVEHDDEPGRILSN